MTPVIWPSTDIYFFKGINSLLEESKPHLKSTQDHVIVDFRISTIKNIYTANWLLTFPGKKIIIIADKHLFPLACYFFKIFDNIITVIEEKTADQCLLNYFKHEKINKTVGICLSNREYLSLGFFMNAHSISYQAQKLGVDIKTAYAFRKSAAKKMRLKRLIDMFSVC